MANSRRLRGCSCPLTVPTLLIGFLFCLLGAIPSSLCFVHAINVSKAEGSCIGSERRALLAIKADMYDPGDWLSSWRGQDCCRWRGIACDHTTGNVISLSLRYPIQTSYDPLPSKVNPSLLGLMHLKYLDLSMNNFYGACIPKFIGSLRHLEYLNLSGCSFSMSIPRELGNLSTLHSLDLSSCYNAYYWKLFDDDLGWLSGIHSLRHLDLSCAYLFPASNWLSEINMLPSLQALRLSGASLPDIPHVNLPHVNLTSLTLLDLSSDLSSNNLLSISMSHWLSNLSSLEALSLSSIDGLNAENLGWLGALHHLKYLRLDHNQITDDFSQQLRNLSHLESLDLPGNNITRHFLDTAGNLSHLKSLGLGFNLINGHMPEIIGSLYNLQVLDLSGNSIGGGIPETMGKLSNLRYLDLSRNGIGGMIPAETMGKLYNLRYLDLSGNSIGGVIPAETIGKLSNLQYLDLSVNSIGGVLPRAMGSLCKLEVLRLFDNNIGGNITDLIEGLSQCDENKPDGRTSSVSRIPAFTGLVVLDLGNNNFTGMIPESMGQLSKLSALNLSSNSLEGKATEDHFANLGSLDSLRLSYNSLQLNLSQNWIPPFNASDIQLCSCRLGPKFPGWLRTQTRLQSLCLAEAEISDSLPAWIGDLSNLQQLNVSQNQMKGPLPNTLENQTYTDFDVSSNSFNGSIPSLDHSQLLIIDLSNNLFTGSIPSTFGTAHYLLVLSLSNNHLNGSIPSSFCNLNSLEILNLSYNNFSGTPLNCWGKSGSIVAFPPQLEFLLLRRNSLSGNFPLFLRNCSELIILDLGENKFSGNIPKWLGESLPKLKVLSLRSNLFKGHIPAEISNLTCLQVLDLACNNLSGNLPLTFSNFHTMANVQINDSKSILPHDFTADMVPSVMFSSMSVRALYETYYRTYYKEHLLVTTKGEEWSYTSVRFFLTGIDLSQNNLSGEIPVELTALLGLHFLNLSMNHLRGKIPENIGAIKQLESLDLSMNDLSGVIPASITSLNFLCCLNLSNNNLSGRIPSGGQLSTFNASVYGNNDNLCGWPLQNCLSSNTPSDRPEDTDENEDPTEIVWTYAFVALGFILGFWGFLCTTMIKRAIRVAYFQFLDRAYDWIYVQLAVRYAKLKSIMMWSNQCLA